MTDATSEHTPPEEDKRRIIEDAIMAFRPAVTATSRATPAGKPGRPSPPWRPPPTSGG